jgi:hypothetical protein
LLRLAVAGFFFSRSGFAAALVLALSAPSQHHLWQYVEGCCCLGLTVCCAFVPLIAAPFGQNVPPIY